MADLTFLPWARSGAGASLNPGTAAAPTNRPSFQVKVTVTKTLDNGSQTQPIPPPTLQMTMLGPGDVVGISGSQIIRTEPADGSTGVETELFPAVEFADSTLPWMFTPSTEIPGHRLQPWICLVVVPVREGIVLDRASRRLTITGPADSRVQLPDLSESWAWAHVQYAGTDLGTDPVAAAANIGRDPKMSLSRLLCPRRLEANTQYIACVVPTYKAGRSAGLGENPDPGGAAVPAWDVSPAGEPTVTLPVYFSFTFTTGEGGDFRSLAQLLIHPPQLSGGPDGGLGARTLKINIPPPPPPAPPPSTSLPMPGMLQSVSATAAPPPDTVVKQWLQKELTPLGAMPQLRPPLYGAMQAGIRPRDLAGNFGLLPLWWTTLNLDPRLRVAAALGKRVVALEREHLVAAAWAQVEQAREVNAQLCRAQLARSVSSQQVRKHFPSPQAAASPAGALALLQLASPQAARVQMAVTPPAAPGVISTAPIGGSVLSLVENPAFAPRLAAMTSAAYRRITRPRGPLALRASRPTPAPQGLVAFTQLRAQFNPDLAVPTRVISERLSPVAAALATRRPDDPLRELAPDVSYPFGMITPLAQVAEEAILPGASTIPPNTALPLLTNPEQIAAYMVGLNTEIARVLLWRGIPFDRRGTPFKWFWDVRGQVATGQAGPPPDMQPIASWNRTDTLASEFGGTPSLVLAIRSDLFRRYPQTAVFAAPAVPVTGTPNHTVGLGDATKLHTPRFTAMLPPDLRLFGFDLKQADAVSLSVPGYFFVLQQQASETRFGSDALSAATPPGGAYWPVAALGITQPHAGQVADKVRMLPVIVAIHARALLPPSH